MDSQRRHDVCNAKRCHIKRRLGFCSGVALIVGGIIGSGIFVSPKGILANTGCVGLSLDIWCVCGFISILGTYGSLATGFEGSEKNPLVELGLLIPRSGGDFNYLLKVFGTFPAFMFAWCQNLPLCVITSITLVTAIYSLVNIAYFSVLTKDEFLSSWAVAVTWAKYEINSAVIIVPIIVACSSYGTLTIAFFISSRLSSAAARAGLFPRNFVVLEHTQ
ncbi:b(0,+)-type amino acid transporter 1-like [Mytilus californianus]|uniref:b(0,+)-type amino acid transporter 1-like n=1 Tax=Mytilus californianus TaxID=6549 RepID=UPI002247827C|nr:b(0,+)-type amino acid transporter 1-like [Mytilus californianus]